MTTKKTIPSPLRDERIVVRPVKRQAGWVYNNIGKSRVSGSRNLYAGVPYDSNRRKYVEPLTEEEREWFAQHSGLGLTKDQLSPNTKEGKEFWNAYKMTLKGDESITLYLSDASDFLRYAFLKAQINDIAPTLAEEKFKLTYLYVLVSVKEEEESKASRVDRMKEAYMYLGSIDQSIPKMKGFLKAYYKHKKSGKTVPRAVNREYLVGEIDNVINDDINGFFHVKEDKNLEIKGFIEECVDRGVINKKDKNTYEIPGYDDDYNLGELAEYLKLPENTKIYGKLKAQLEAVNS